MRVSTFSKIGISLGAAALLATAVVSPAYADPPLDGGDPTYGQLVGLGSDTTQDLVNGLALAIGGGKLASYDAVGSPTVVTRDGGFAVPRASGSGSGRDLLRVALGQTGSATITVPGGTAAVTPSNSVGAIDFARSSSGPSGADTTASGVLAYVPYARDALTIAVNPDSPLAVVPWILGDSSTAGSTTPSLYNVYRGDVRFAYVSGTTGSYAYVGVGSTAGAAPGGSTAYPVQALIPQAGSGTRSYYIGKLGLSEAQITTINTTTPGTIKATYGAGLAIEEHDGAALESDLTGIAPFSIGQWIAQANGVPGVNDRRHGAILLSLNGTAPITGSAGSYAANPAYSAMVRDVYNIVPSRLLDDPASKVAAMFKGSSSLICQQSATILAYGFQLMPGGTAAATCGYSQLRAYTASVSSTTLALSSHHVAPGDSITATVTVTSNANQGGDVVILDGDDNEVATGTIVAGTTSKEISVSIADAGSYDLHAEFVPALPGIAGSSSADESVVVPHATTTSISRPSTGQLGKPYSVIVWVDGAADAGGTVTLKDGATVLATSTLGAGETGAFLTFTLTKKSYSFVASYAAPVDSEALDSTSSAKALDAGKGLPTLTVPTPKSVKASTAGKVSVTVTGIPGVVPTGTVTIKEGTKVLALDKVLVAGKVTITLPKLKKGTHTLTVIYSGDSEWLTVTKSSVKIKIT